MIFHEDHEVNIYFHKGDEKEVNAWIEDWKGKGYKITFECWAKNGEQGNITMTKKVIPESWTKKK